jgi:hypothetical protein
MIVRGVQSWKNGLKGESVENSRFLLPRLMERILMG